MPNDLSHTTRQSLPRTELATYAGIIVLAVLANTIFTVPVELGGDAIHKWEFVLDLLGGAPASDFVLNHHNARWGINIPTLAITWAFGTSWSVYYVAPILYYAAFLILSAVFFRRYAAYGLFGFAFFVVILFGDPLYYRSTTQLQPFIFVAAYMTAHILVVCRLVRRFSVLLCFLAAFFIFLAYGAKETAMFYAPATAIFVFVVMDRRTALKTIAWMAVFGLLLIALETLLFSWANGQFTTRFDTLHNHFHSLDTKYNHLSFLDLFNGWAALYLYTWAIFLTAAIVIAMMIFGRVRFPTPVPILMLILLFVCFALLETLLIKSIDPYMPFTPPKRKYLADLVPWACMIIALALDRAVAALQSPPIRRRFVATTLAAASAVCVVSIVATPLHATAWMWRADRAFEEIADAVRSGIPIRGGRKTRFFARVISVPIKRVAHEGGSFWVYDKVETPAETLLAGKCYILKFYGIGAFRLKDCLK